MAYIKLCRYPMQTSEPECNAASRWLSIAAARVRYQVMRYLWTECREYLSFACPSSFIRYFTLIYHSELVQYDTSGRSTSSAVSAQSTGTERMLCTVKVMYLLKLDYLYVKI
jgi:hypothetical protein